MDYVVCPQCCNQCPYKRRWREVRPHREEGSAQVDAETGVMWAETSESSSLQELSKVRNRFPLYREGSLVDTLTWDFLLPELKED